MLVFYKYLDFVVTSSGSIRKGLGDLRDRAFKALMKIKISIELSHLIDCFMKTTEESLISALIVGLRRYEVGLVVPAKFSAFMRDKRIANILYDKTSKIKTKYSHFEMKFEDSKVVKLPYLR